MLAVISPTKKDITFAFSHGADLLGTGTITESGRLRVMLAPKPAHRTRAVGIYFPYTISPPQSSILVKAMSESEVEGASATRKTIERTYRERGRGFLAWARRHAPDAATAEDIFQDAFIRALANADALSPVEDLAAWIFSAMRNRLIDLWRGEGARRRAGATELPEGVLEEVAAEAGLDPQERLQRNEILAALDVAIDALPAPQREVIRAQALGGVAFRELAEATGVSIDTLMARKRYAIRKLAAALEYWMDD